jgi:hypothetical protein
MSRASFLLDFGNRLEERQALIIRMFKNCVSLANPQ